MTEAKREFGGASFLLVVIDAVLCFMCKLFWVASLKQGLSRLLNESPNV